MLAMQLVGCYQKYTLEYAKQHVSNTSIYYLKFFNIHFHDDDDDDDIYYQI